MSDLHTTLHNLRCTDDSDGTLCRHWPVVVMGMSDLPSSIACGACALQPGSGFPLSLAEASSKGRAEEAYPVLVLGTQVNLGPYTISARAGCIDCGS